MQRMNVIVLATTAALATSFSYAHEGDAARAIGPDEPLLLAQARATKAGAGKEIQQIHDHMGMMQQKMDRYHASKDQKERAKLRAELYTDMRDHMKLMRGPGGMDSGRMMGGDAKKRQEMMEMRMDQMHQMMDWMLTFDSDFRPLGP